MSQDKNLTRLTEDIVLGFEGVSRFSKHGKTTRSGEYTNSSIKIDEEDGEYTINIDILVYYGVNIPQLSYDIQTGLIHSLMEHAGIIVKTVNIRIEGIDKED
ncbi:MAG: Asp23/Gls24 family envelope stress response protein [Mogibacterium sp.]|nr:Asp23/Gls24 family envelope stress response protein [Mogibacterium sp.]